MISLVLLTVVSLVLAAVLGWAAVSSALDSVLSPVQRICFSLAFGILFVATLVPPVMVFSGGWQA